MADNNLNPDSLDHELIDELADEYVSRKQAGEAPVISEYCRQHPELQQEIRALFPMLSLLEQAKDDRQKQASVYTVPVPPRLGDYELVREIGRGGMGVIY